MNLRRDRVHWFHEQLKKQLAFAELEAAGAEIVTFFDTAEVQASLLGMYDLLRHGTVFNVKNFRRRNRLVHALAAAGWLGPLRLLVPHESELLANLQKGFGSRADGFSPKQMADRFLLQLDISIPLKATALGRMSFEERRKYVKKHVGSAEKLFKVIHLITGSWQIRFMRWRQSGRLVFSSGDFDVAEAMRLRRFKNLREILDNQRPAYRMNNLTDALALVELSQRVEAWKKGKVSKMPVLFTSTRTVSSALSRLDKDSRIDLFSLPVGSGEFLSAVQDNDYFVFRAMFDPPEEYVSERADDVHISIRGGGLERLRAEVADLLEARTNLQKSEELRSLWSYRAAHRIIDQLETFSFFENVWLAKAEKDIEEVEGELRESARRLRNKPFQESVSKLLRENLDELAAGAQAYEATLRAWEALGRALISLRGMLGGESVEDLDPFLRFGLLRFALPLDSHLGIRSIVADLLSGSAIVERNAKAEAIRIFQEAMRGKGVSETKLAVLAGVLWCLELDQELIEVLKLARSGRKRKRFQHFSLEVILAAAELRGDDSFGEAWEIITYLDGRIAKMRASERRGELMIGVAYLYFHYLLRAESTQHRLGAQREKVCRERGIALAMNAINESVERSKRMYALNQYLYYAVEAVALERLDDIEEKASELEGALDQPGWQYRFDDTLARYYWLQASLAESEPDWRRLLNQALKYIEKAQASALNDPVVSKGHGQMSIESRKGFRFRRELKEALELEDRLN